MTKTDGGNDRPDGQKDFTVGEWDGGLSPGVPLAVDGCVLVLCVAGAASLSVNSRIHSLEAGTFTFLVSDMVTVPVSVSPDFKARFLSATPGMAQDIFFMVTSNRFWDQVYRNPVFVPTDRERGLLDRWFDMAHWVLDSCPDLMSAKIVKDLTENLLAVLSWRIEASRGDLGIPPLKNRAWSIVNDFLALLGRHYSKHHDVAFYAGRLHVTPNYLNIIVRRYTGTSAKEQISIQLMLVFKMLLDTTDMPVKGIAERLGYDDPSYMCRVFRRREGMSPMQYRNLHRGQPPGA